MLRILPGAVQLPKKFYDQASAGLAQVLQDQGVGFWQVPQRLAELETAQKIFQQREYQKPKMILFGVGGSSLGPQFLADLYAQSDREVLVCDNVDPVYFERILTQAGDLQECLFLFISKSGSTIETLVSLQLLHERLPRGWEKRALVISEPKTNPLTTWAKDHQVPVIPMPVDVGGRFSILTSVGMGPIIYLQQNPARFLKGAEWALRERNLTIELIAHSLASFERQEWVTLFWSYSSMLKFFNSWMIQLWAESLAKKTTKTGAPAPRVSTPWTAVGATDQHSLLQQVMDGARDKWVVLHRVKSLSQGLPLKGDSLFPHLSFMKGKSVGQLFQAEAVAIGKALRHENINLLELELDDLSPESMGALLMTWQLVVAGLGTSLGIDPFNQPGVELGKRLALDILNG